MSSYYDWSAVAHEPAVVDFYGSPESQRVPAPLQSPGIRKRADALAEARAELASLREAEAVASSAHKKAQDLATLKAELSYLQSLSSKPKSYLIPPDDEERPLQVLGFYSYTSQAYEPRVVDYYGGPTGGAPNLSPYGASPRVAQQATELASLRQELAELQRHMTPSNLRRLAAEEFRAMSTPGASPGASGWPGTEASGWPATATPRALQLADQLAAAKAELSLMRLASPGWGK